MTDLREYYFGLNKKAQQQLVQQLGITKRYLEYHLLGDVKPEFQRHPSSSLVRKIHRACRGALTFTEILATWWPELASEAKISRVSDKGATPAADTGSPETNRVDQRRPRPKPQSVNTDQSVHGG